MSLSSAKSRVMFAQEYLDKGRYDEIEPLLEAAVGYLVDVPEAETVTVVAEIAAIRAALTTVIMPEEQRYISAAERNVDKAKGDIAAGNIMPSGILDTLTQAEGYLADVRDAHKAALLDEIAVLRAMLGGQASSTASASGTATGAAATDAPATPSEDDERVLSRAKMSVTQARNAIESRRTEGIAEFLDEVEAGLRGIEHERQATLVADINTLREELADAVRAEDTRRIEEQLSRQFMDAEEVQTWHPEISGRAIDMIVEILASDATTRILTPQALAAHQDRLAHAIANRAALIEENALSRATPLLEELEARLQTDPFAGLDEYAAYTATSQLRSLESRVLHELHDLPADLPSVLAITRRLDAARDTVDAASMAWGKAVLDAEVGNSWAMIERDIEGWMDESVEHEGRLLDVPDLPKTRDAIMRIGYLLADPQTLEIRRDNAGDAVIEETYRTAERVHTEAAARMALAYDKVLDHADTVETPMRRDELDKTMHLRTAAMTSLDGTSERDSVVARIQGLENRWKAEVAAIMQSRQDLYDTLAAEADAAWPAIVERTGAIADWEPGDASAIGRTVLLQGVYNRSGWDFSGYDFAMRLNGMPVGGTYEPYVLQALEHAWYELKLDVNDCITWDVIGVVLGSGSIGRRTEVIIKDKATSLQIGTMEEWPSIDCVRVKVIGLHAGPVAVGPAS